MPLENLRDVLIENLKDLYNAEKQLTKALPKMAKAATTPELKEAFEEHLEQTENHVTRLEEAFQELDMSAKSKRCQAMEGLIEEGKEVIEEKSDSESAAVDAALIVAAQKVEHYEISAYGSVRTFAQALGLDQLANLLQETLDEESETNEKLNHLAEEVVNPAAAQGGGEEESEEGEFAHAGSAMRGNGRKSNGRSRSNSRSRRR